jgi:2-polyprenyl-3-methyl-5-hydroxy-6-metoxy-1,4-benzoquinol methylase
MNNPNSVNVSWEEAVSWLRKQPEKQDLVRACYYDDPLLDSAKRFEASEEWQETLKQLPKPAGRALDFGAGRGISSYALAVAGWQVMALEPDASQLVGVGAIRTLSRESGLSIEITQSYAEEMDFGDGAFDLVYTREVLHHARDLNIMLRQVYRSLKPGALFLACREHVISRKEDLPVFLDNHPLHNLYGGEHAYLLSEYFSAYRNSGLVIKKIFGHYENVINYFPMTEAQRRDLFFHTLSNRLGEPLANSLLDPRFPWSSSVTQLISKIKSGKSDFPGRLYTFVAQKPL